MQRSPFEGLGKPEALKENLAGFWSRRIDETNRVVYVVDNHQLTIISCRYHYEKGLQKGFPAEHGTGWGGHITMRDI